MGTFLILKVVNMSPLAKLIRNVALTTTLVFAAFPAVADIAVEPPAKPAQPGWTSFIKEPIDSIKAVTDHYYVAPEVSFAAYHWGMEKGYSVTHHDGTKRGYYNQENPGIGFEAGSSTFKNNQFFAYGMVYKDSYSNPTAHTIGVGARANYDFNPFGINVELSVGFKAGYLNGSGYKGILALPTFSIGHGNFHLNALLAPKGNTGNKNDAYAAGFTLRYDIPIAKSRMATPAPVVEAPAVVQPKGSVVYTESHDMGMGF